ncbi:hypothetical protein ACSUZJ_06260 [Telluria sp. B2]
MAIIEKSQSLKSGEPLIVYELNEVPWRVIDWYVRLKPHSALARLLVRAKTFTTVTKDDGELHPWTTWPAFHRGVNNSQHKIRFINQSLDVAAQYPPIWETLSRAGKRVGVFGSLQSYPPPKEGAYEFYVPDTFSPGCETLPAKYSSFQRFNLRQTQQDGAKASPLQFDGSIANDILRMMQVGLRFATCKDLALHVAKEQINPLHRSRRAVLQALVAFDIFRHALNDKKPDFCTFFTNHVAGVMHRYWKHTFPQDFNAVLTTDEERFHANSIAFAMDIADAQIEHMMSYVQAANGMLIVASSMGQEAIDRGSYFGEWRITDVQTFFKAIGWQAPAKDLLAMQPDFNFSFDSDEDAERFLHLTERLTDTAGKSIWKRMQRVGSTVNLGMAPSQIAMTAGEAIMLGFDGLHRKLTIAEMGIQFIKRDQGTGYHQPRGVLLLYGSGVKHDDSRLEIDSTAVRPEILKLFGVECDARG